MPTRRWIPFAVLAPLYFLAIGWIGIASVTGTRGRGGASRGEEVGSWVSELTVDVLPAVCWRAGSRSAPRSHKGTC